MEMHSCMVCTLHKGIVRKNFCWVAMSQHNVLMLDAVINMLKLYADALNAIASIIVINTVMLLVYPLTSRTLC